MKILYFLEPWIEMANPTFRYGAFCNAILKQSGPLLKKKCEIKVLVGEGVAYEIRRNNIDHEPIGVRVAPMASLLKCFDSYHVAADTFYKGLHDQETLRKYEEIVLEALDGFEPDIILSWESPVAYMQEIFPKALVLNLMPGMMSRVPFPELLSIDPCGFFQKGIINTHSKKLIDYLPTAGENSFLYEVRSHYVENFLKLCTPFTRTDLDPEGRFDKLILLPLQVSGYFAFDSNCGYKNQLDFVVKVLEETPLNFGVVVTQYVTPNTADRVIQGPAKDFLSEKYPNLIYREAFDAVDGISQYLLGAVDGVATVSSSIGLQALLWQKPVFVFGESHLSPFSKGNTLTAITSTFHLPLNTAEFDGALIYILTRLQPLLLDLVYESPWFYKFLKEAHSRHLNGIRGLELFDPIENIHVYTKRFLSAAKFGTAIRKLDTAAKARKDLGSTKARRTIFQNIFSNQYKVISFDIFDTLLVRPFAKPVDLFRMLISKVADLTGGEISDFLEVRTLAERNLKQRVKEAQLTAEEGAVYSSVNQEITFAAIYEEIGAITGLSFDILRHVADLEVKTELDLLYPRQSGKQLYTAAIASGKKVIITSDMYLSKDVIEKVLKKNGFGDYHKLYLSSEIGLKKHDGDLFQYLLYDLGMTGREVLHFGDNSHGDIAKGKEYGLSTYFTKSTLNCFYSNKRNNELFYKKRNDATLAESIVVGLAANKLFDDPEATYWEDTHFNGETFNLGYYGLGWMFTAFVKWILEEAIKDGVDRLYFLSRDGDIIKKTYDLLAKSYPGAPESHYILSSRRSTRVASLGNQSDVLSLARSSFHKGGTIGDYLCKKLGLMGDAVDAGLYAQYGFEGPEHKIWSNDEKEQALSLVSEVSPLILESAKKERELYLGYLAEEGFFARGKVALVDIGYAGTMQNALIGMTARTEVGGYYFMTFFEAKHLYKSGQIVKGFCGDFVEKGRSWHPVCKLGLAFEVFFSNTSGSFVKFKENNLGHHKPVFEDTAGEDAKMTFVPKLHNGILAFVEDFTTKFTGYMEHIDFDSESCLSIFVDFLTKPAGRDAEILEGVTFDDNFAGAGFRYMVPPRSIGEFTVDWQNKCVWKQGSEVFFRRPDIKAVANPKKSDLFDVSFLSQRGEEYGLAANARPTLLMRFLIKVCCSERKYKKYLKDPAGFHRDSKFRVIRALGSF